MYVHAFMHMRMVRELFSCSVVRIYMHGLAATVNAPKLISMHACHRFNAGPALFPAFVLQANMILHVTKHLLHCYTIVIAFIRS